MKRSVFAVLVIVLALLLTAAKCTSTGGTAGNILPAGEVTKSNKKGWISWEICVKAENDPKDTFADGVIFCNVKETSERGERCPVGSHWPTCGEKQN